MRENPQNNYPFLFCKEVLQDELGDLTKSKLREIIFGDQEALFNRILLQKIAANDFFDVCRRDGIDVLSKSTLRTGRFTLKQVVVTYILRKCLDLGAKTSGLKRLARYLLMEQQIEQVMLKINMGFSVFLYTDLNGCFDLPISTDLLDWIVAGHDFSQPFISLSMNAVFHEALNTFLKNPAAFRLNNEIRHQVGMSSIQDCDGGQRIAVGLPKGTSMIDLFRPLSDIAEPGGTVLTDAEYLKMIRIRPIAERCDREGD